jgi:hypothetical protein
MRSCGSLRGMRARKFDGIETVGLFVGFNRCGGFTLLRCEHLRTLKLGITSANFFPAGHSKNNLL